MATLSRKFKDLRFRVFYGLLLSRAEVVTLGAGDSKCRWTICPTGLNAGSVVYSGGVGSDISFEHDLVRRFGCNVLLFDPSPTGLETMGRAENQIPQFRFYPIALAGRNGRLRLAPPLDSRDASWFANPHVRDGLEVACRDLETLMRDHGHEHIDLLKLDIEGCEYEVVDQILKRRLAVRQLCVEFHHRLVPGIRRSQTIGSVFRLLRAGYRLVNVTGNDHTFIRSGC
ncbi:MAG: FkbM family methyltransferase [Verrucomicrobiae bacterium]|nr:FkbM family methyltransferase [Verrucomicrobiae bacterium]MDW8309800.1 FkbM family methyltransferase [Verrucomicrobiales bacterium]